MASNHDEDLITLFSNAISPLPPGASMSMNVECRRENRACFLHGGGSNYKLNYENADRSTITNTCGPIMVHIKSDESRVPARLVFSSQCENDKLNYTSRESLKIAVQWNHVR